MILKGSQRGGGLQLANHLLNDRDNDHVTLHEVRGFVAEDLHGALAEAYAVSKGTRCEQFMFSLSLNPPKGEACDLEAMVEAADRAEKQLGLSRQPRAIVVHEKEGRRHIHVVWSRIDPQTMKAVELPFFKNKLASLSKELYLDHGWELPEGHRENRWKNPLNFTLAEWQQAKRLGLDPRELKALFRDAWAMSDGVKSFRAALVDRGYYLATGDQRGFVAVDLRGEIFSIARMVGIKTRDVAAKLGVPDGLPSVGQVRAENEKHMSERLRGILEETREAQKEALQPALDERKALVKEQREERSKLTEGQRDRLREETNERAARFRKGVRGLWDILTGRAAQTRRQNELDRVAGLRRDAQEREAMFHSQLAARHDLQSRIEEQRKAQREERMQTAQQVAFLLELERSQNSGHEYIHSRNRARAPTLH